MPESPSLTDLTGTAHDGGQDPAVITLDDEQANELLGAVKSSTARQILQQLHESPTYPSKLTDKVDTSIQNVHHHLINLEEAGAVEVVDTVFSEKGREMNVYAPTAEPLVIVSGSEDGYQDVVDTLSKLLGAIGVLALGSVVVQLVIKRLFYPGGPITHATEGSQYAVPPMTNVAPPVGLYVFVAGFLVILSWYVWLRR